MAHTLREPAKLNYFGGRSPGGTYNLRIEVSQRLCIAFGGFGAGKPIVVEPGSYLYLGSALSQRGATSLGRRLVRHATRTGRRMPHPIRETMLSEFPEIDLGRDLLLAKPKQLHWHVDYLLDSPAASLTAAYVIRVAQRLEGPLGQFLLRDPAVVAFAPRLGATDVPGNTHLLRVEPGEAWWREWPSVLGTWLRDV